MPAYRRLVEDVKGSAVLLLTQLPGQLHPLRLTTGKGGGRLPDPTSNGSGAHARSWAGSQETKRLLHPHGQNIRDAVGPQDPGRLPVVTLPPPQISRGT